MEKIAIYGKGGIGKSMIATSLSAFFALGGKRVLHVGCDPKHDSAVRLLESRTEVRTVLEVLGNDTCAEATNDILISGRHGIVCCEAGGPPAGLGCGGRGVARTIEYLDEHGFLQSGHYDVVVFDVLGDVVCGGFAAPLRDGFAEKLVIVISEEPMSLFAANNIARAVDVYKRNGVYLAGLVANLRCNEAKLEPLEHFAARLGTSILGVIQRDPQIMAAERDLRTVVEYSPESESARSIAALGGRLLALNRAEAVPPHPLTDNDFFDFIRHLESVT